MKGAILMQLWKHSLKRETLGRTLVDLQCSEFELAGDGIDLGAKDSQSSYHSFFRKTNDIDIEYSDFYSDAPGIIKVDLEAEIPMPDQAKDFVLLFNVLEHLYGYDLCISEINRILKPGGKLFGCVPFLHKYHPDPDDFFRYTETALRRIFTGNDFSDVDIKPLGYGPVSTGFALFDRLPRIGPIIFLLRVMAIGTDRLLNIISRGHRGVHPQNFPLAYFFVCTKKALD